MGISFSDGQKMLPIENGMNRTDILCRRSQKIQQIQCRLSVGVPEKTFSVMLCDFFT